MAVYMGEIQGNKLGKIGCGYFCGNNLMPCCSLYLISVDNGEMFKNLEKNNETRVLFEK